MTGNNVGAITYTDNSPAYLGQLFVVGANQTPFLSMMGGMKGYKPASGFEFALEQYAAYEAAQQRVVTEAAAVAGTATPKTYVKAQRTNAIEIHYHNIEVSYAKAADRLKLSGIYYAEPFDVMQNEMDFQTQMVMGQLAIDMEYSCLQGTYVTKSAYDAASSTRGMVEAASGGTSSGGVNVVAAGSTALTKAHIDSVSKKMADSGARLVRPVIFAGSFQMQKLSDLYGWSPIGGTGAGLGGVRVERLITQFFEAEVVFAPQMPASALLIADMAFCQLRGLEIPGRGAIVIEPKGKVGAADSYQLVAHLGLDYGDPNFHGVITGLATS